jgi:hypothetical protein
MYFRQGLARPVWIIESEIPGAGKTTLAFILGELYRHAPIEVKVADFRRDVQEITKRCVSPEGRQARILLVDNVTGTFACQELSSMITAPWITGRPSYGRNEESRPNNLTYIITANNASVDNDLAIRCYTVKLKALASYDANWSHNLNRFIAENRLQVFADIMDLIGSHQPFQGVKPSTRYPDFEESILQPCCGPAEMYGSVIERIKQARTEANIEGEWGNAIEDVFRNRLVDLRVQPDQESVFIHSVVANVWIREAISDQRLPNPTQVARNLARSGHLPRINADKKVYPNKGEHRRRGLLWMNADLNTAPTKVIVDGGGSPRVKPVMGGANSLFGPEEAS